MSFENCCSQFDFESSSRLYRASLACRSISAAMLGWGPISARIFVEFFDLVHGISWNGWKGHWTLPFQPFQDPSLEF